MPPRIALLILDMVNAFDFPQGKALRRAAEAITGRLAKLKEQVKAHGGICVYANDNFADWNCDFATLVELAHCSAGGRIIETLSPAVDDLRVLKPRHSAFHQTALKHLLDEKGVSRLLITGVSTESCVLATALDARIHHFKLSVVSDCVASSSPVRRSTALATLRHCDIPVAGARSVLAQLR